MMETIADPGAESSAAVDQERAFVGADPGSREPFGDIVGVAAIFEQVGDPPVQTVGGRDFFEPSEFFERRDGAGESEGQTAGERQIVGSRRRFESCLLPSGAELFVDGGDEAAKIVRAFGDGAEIPRFGQLIAAQQIGRQHQAAADRHRRQ